MTSSLSLTPRCLFLKARVVVDSLRSTPWYPSSKVPVVMGSLRLTSRWPFSTEASAFGPCYSTPRHQGFRDATNKQEVSP